MADLCAQTGSLEWCGDPITASNYCRAEIQATACDAGNNLFSLRVVNYNGDLPTSVANLENLEALAFEGSPDFFLNNMPDELADAPRLEVLEFIEGDITGSLPSFAGAYPSLRVLLVRAVAISGGIPQALAESEVFEELIVEDATFSGGIPFQLSNAPLKRFVLRQTDCVGLLPTFGADNSLVEYLVADNDGLTGFNDPFILHGDSLEQFTLENCPNLAGQIPPSLGSTTTLWRFRVFGTQLTGPLPSTVRYATGLEEFSLGGSAAVQEFPEEICELKHLRALGVASWFYGEIPHCLRHLTNLYSVVIDGTGQNTCGETENIVGSLPIGIADVLSRRAVADASRPELSQQIRLVVSNTCLKGPLPELDDGNEVSAPTEPGLTVVSISRNQFVSPYPDWLQLFLTDPDYNIGNSRCFLEDNLFCLKPVPLGLGSAQCALTLDGVVNVCGLCNEPDEACEDCKGVLNGPARVDRCGVCGGLNECLDCAGEVDGSAEYDACDVCQGDGTTCYDCQGVMFGTSQYDLCDVCDGDGSSCLDCSGVPFGSYEYDLCDVCGGQGLSCADCEGVVGGPKELDLCGECVDVDATDYRPSCVDCAGVPNGSSVRDRCHVCDGDGSTCEDARHVLAAQLALDRFGWLVVLPIVLVVVLCLVLGYVAFASTGLGSTRRRPRSRRVRVVPVETASASSRIPDLVGPQKPKAARVRSRK